MKIRHPEAPTLRKPTEVQSVLRAVKLLEFLADHASGITGRQLSATAGLNISTCHHLLSTLVSVGMARVDSQHQYFLGLKIGELHRKYTVGTSVVQRIRHHLEDLSFRTLETSYLTAWRDGNGVLVDAVETLKPALKSLRPGYAGPAYSRAGGKVLLAGLSEDELAAYFRQTPLLPITTNTITNEEDLRTELTKIRTQGYAIDREEHQLGSYCVAAPIFSRSGKTVGAMAVSVATERAGDLEEIVHAVTGAARIASSDIGDFI